MFGSFSKFAGMGESIIDLTFTNIFLINPIKLDYIQSILINCLIINIFFIPFPVPPVKFGMGFQNWLKTYILSTNPLTTIRINCLSY